MDYILCIINIIVVYCNFIIKLRVMLFYDFNIVKLGRLIVFKMYIV